MFLSIIEKVATKTMVSVAVVPLELTIPSGMFSDVHIGVLY